ncbi:MAG TPA: recombinase family protein [Candidatus Absconditabacterales bacterium]|nr:recombinase family protein [Candidatus Absconditabacterales bacterium]
MKIEVKFVIPKKVGLGKKHDLDLDWYLGTPTRYFIFSLQPMYNKNPFQNKSNAYSQKKVALIYCRVSTKRQAEERFGIETQEAMCKDWCEKNDVYIYKIIKDGGVSGGTFDRDGFDEVLDILEKQKKRLEKIDKERKKKKPGEKINELTDLNSNPIITHFVCVDGSRISRNDNMAETLVMTNKIREAGVEILYVMYPVDYNTSAGMLQENILYAFSAFERRNTRVKAMNGMRARLVEGYRPFGGTPIGYRREKAGKNTVVVIHETKGPIVKEALEMYANGVLESESAVFRYMKDKGLQSNSHHNTKGELYKTIVETLFTLNRLYFMAGYIHHPQRGLDDLIPAKHEALITMDVVEKILRRRGESKFIGKTMLKHNPDFPLKDFLFCGHCQKKLTGYRAKGRNDKYPYYGCQNAKDPERFQIKRELLHEQFDVLLSKVAINEGVWNLMEEVIKKLRDGRKDFQGKLDGEKRLSVEKMQKDMTQIRRTILKTDNIHLIEEMEAEWELLRVEKETVQHQLDDKEKITDQELKELLVQAKNIYMGPKSVWEMSNVELKKMLMGILFGDKLMYTKEKGFRTAGNSLYEAVLSAIQTPDFLA